LLVLTDFKAVVVVVPRKEAMREESASDVCGLVEMLILEMQRLILIEAGIGKVEDIAGQELTRRVVE
jgi:hypothetical protein